MNKARREKLKDAIRYFDHGLEILDDALTEESDCLSNMPENLESSDRYMSLEDNVDTMESVYSDINEAKDQLEGLI